MCAFSVLVHKVSASNWFEREKTARKHGVYGKVFGEQKQYDGIEWNNKYATSIGFNRNHFLCYPPPLLGLSIESMSNWLVLLVILWKCWRCVFWWNWAKKIHGSSWNDSNSSNGSISYFEIIHERMVQTEQTEIVSGWYWWLFSLVYLCLYSWLPICITVSLPAATSRCDEESLFCSIQICVVRVYRSSFIHPWITCWMRASDFDSIRKALYTNTM